CTDIVDALWSGPPRLASLSVPARQLAALLESGRIGTDGQQDIASARWQHLSRFATGSRGSMGTDVEATCAPPNHLPIATIASSPKPAADNWNCDQSHRTEHSDLTFDYCVARNDLHQRHRPVRSYSWTRPPAPLLPRNTRVEHMPHR